MGTDDKYYNVYFEVMMRVEAASDEEAQLAAEDELETLLDVYQVNCTSIWELEK